jgi:hypothetical protein
MAFHPFSVLCQHYGQGLKNCPIIPRIAVMLPAKPPIEESRNTSSALVMRLR